MAGRWGGRRIEAPRGRRVRPTADRVREAWMSAVAGSLEGARVLDLYAGSGALGLEALSRGAREVVFVERSQKVIEVLRRNLSALDAGEAAHVVRADALDYASRQSPGAFDLAFADPPYDLRHATRLFRILRERGFAAELWVEHGRDEDPGELPGLVRRRYGDTMLSVLRREATDSERLGA